MLLPLRVVLNLSPSPFAAVGPHVRAFLATGANAEEFKPVRHCFEAMFGRDAFFERLRTAFLDFNNV